MKKIIDSKHICYMNKEVRRWYIVALFNLFFLTLLGLILRYKINFPLPFVEQKNLLHAHSHFAFNGWVSFLLQVLIVDWVKEDFNKNKLFWNRFFTISTIINYAMVIAFAWQGYKGFSIALSTVAVWLSYVFVFRVMRIPSREQEKKVSNLFLSAALLFLVLSSLGPYMLAYIIATKNTHQYFYHNALYFFLHFQYNGWFLFSVFSFLMKKLEAVPSFPVTAAKRLFYILFISCFPAYLLTVLWHHPPVIVIWINILTVLFQAGSLYYGYFLFYNGGNKIFRSSTLSSKYLFNFSIAGFIIKILLQFFSAHPKLGQIAFAFRPIIIGYLHLVFLVIVSLFLLGILVELVIIPASAKMAKRGLVLFASGVIINEILLAFQGVASIVYWYLPSVSILLFINTIMMVAGSLFIFLSSRKLLLM